MLTEIIEFDELNNWLYVAMKSIISQHFIIYKIDLANHGSTLITIGWFKYQG